MPTHKMKAFIETDYIVGVWYVNGDHTNWMCVAWKSPQGWEGHYRFRYERISDPVINTPWSGLDEKSWYSLSIREMSEDELITGLSTVAQEVATMWDSTLQFIPIHGNSDALIKALKDQPWAHMKGD